MLHVFALALTAIAATLAIRLAVLTRLRIDWLLISGAVVLLTVGQAASLLSEGSPFLSGGPADLSLLIFSALLVAGLGLMTLRPRSDDQAEAARENHPAAENGTRDIPAGGNDRFGLFAEQAAEQFWSTGPDTGRVVQGIASERIWGRSSTELNGDPSLWLEAIHPEDLEKVFGAWTRLLESRGTEPYDVEYRVTRPDGSLRWVHDRATPLCDASGTVVQICGIAGDVTDRKRADDQLWTVVDSTLAALLLVDASGVIVLAGAPVARIFGYRRGDLIGQPIEILLPDGMRDGVMRGVRANGTRVPIEVGVSRIETADGALMLGCVADISERKQLEQEREKLQDRLVESQRLESLGVLAGGVAHDFNNLLTLVLCNAQLARSDVAPGSDVAAALAQIEQATFRASELTAQMLAYAGKGEMVVGPVDLSALVADSAALLKAALPGAALLELDLGASLPAIEGDPSQIRQILVGLVTNAGEALVEEHGTVTVRTGSILADKSYLRSTVLGGDTKEGRYTFLEVSDDGIGMTEALQAQIFEPFVTTRTTGRGLGLAAVLGILRRHHGTIRVESRPGRGTTIRVLLPLAGQAEQGRAAVDDARTGGVLLVDDEQDVLRVIRKFLERAGFEVHPAASGEEALACFCELGTAVDAIVLDLTMPGMGGEELLAAIRGMDLNVPVIVTSGYNESEVARRCAGLGVFAYLPKPYLPAELTAEVRRAVTAGRLHRVGSPVPK